MISRAFIAGVALLLAGACDQVRSLLPPPSFDGAYAIIEVDRDQLVDEHLNQLSEQVAETLRVSGVRYSGRGVTDGVMRIRLAEPNDVPRAVQALSPITGHLVLTEAPDGVIEGRIADAYLQSIVDQGATQSIDVLQRRLVNPSQFLVEPYGRGRLVVRTGASTITAQTLRAITVRGQLTFHVVHEVTPERLAVGRLPPGAILAQPYLSGTNPEAVDSRPSLVGHIVRANVSTDSITGQFVVSFEFDDEGKRAFCRITRDGVGKRFAVLMDGQVITAPMINEPICGGSGQISGNFTAESANDMATLLRAGGLPVSFTVVAQGAGAPAPPPT